MSLYAPYLFKEDYSNTIGIKFHVKSLEIDDTPVKLQIWDLKGAKRFRSLIPTFFKNTHGVILVFDLTRPETFANLEYWLRLINENTDNPKTILVGTKLDIRLKSRCASS